MEGEGIQAETLLLAHGKNSDAITLLQKDSLSTSVIVLSGVHMNALSAEM